MSKLTDRSKKDIFYPSTGLEQDRNKKPVKKLSGENTGKIKKDKSGKDYSLIQETTENFIKGDTIRPGNLPRVDSFIQGGDYKVSETPESKKRATDEPRTFSPVRLENKYSSMKSMGQAVARWTSPNKLTGEASKKEQDKESVKKYGVAGSSKRTKKAVKSIAKDDAKAKKAKEKFEKSIEYKVDKKATKKQAKKDYKESEEGKEATAKKREKATDITQAIGRAMAAAGGTTVKTPSKTASQKGKEQRDKEKKDKDKEKLKEQDSSKTNLEKSDIGAKT